MEQLLTFIVLGAVGGFAAILTVAEGWGALVTFASFKRYVIGAIVGGLYFLLYSEHDFPNLVMAFVSGYCGTDFISKLVERYKGRRAA